MSKDSNGYGSRRPELNFRHVEDPATPRSLPSVGNIDAFSISSAVAVVNGEEPAEPADRAQSSYTIDRWVHESRHQEPWQPRAAGASVTAATQSFNQNVGSRATGEAAEPRERPEKERDTDPGRVYHGDETGEAKLSKMRDGQDDGSRDGARKP